MEKGLKSDNVKTLENINKIIKNEDIYLIEFKLKVFVETIEICIIDINNDLECGKCDEVLFNLNLFIEKYKGSEQIIKTGFERLILKLIKKIKPGTYNEYLKCICQLDITYEESELNILRKTLSYNKIYTIFKDIIAIMFNENYNYKYLGLIIKLLDNKDLVYKNLKGMLSKLIKYVGNNLVEKGVVNCCELISAIMENEPTIFNEKLICTILTYLIEILYTPKNFLFLNFDDSIQIIGACQKLFRFYIVNDKGFNRKNYSKGIMRKIIGKMIEYRNSTVYEEAMILVNMMMILTDSFELYKRLNNEDNDFNFILKDTSEILNVGFIIKETKDVNIYNKEEFIAFKNDELMKNKLGTFVKPFLEYKYKFLDSLFNFINKNKNKNSDKNKNKNKNKNSDNISNQKKKINSQDNKLKIFKKEEFIKDIMIINSPFCILKQISNLTVEIEWADIITLIAEKPDQYKINFLILLFNDNYLSNMAIHNTYLKLFYKSLTPEYLVYFIAYAVNKKCDFLLIELYFKNISLNGPETNKSKEIILNYICKYNFDFDFINEFELNDIEINNIGYKNIFVFILVLASKTKPLFSSVKNKNMNDFNEPSVIKIDSETNNKIIEPSNKTDLVGKQSVKSIKHLDISSEDSNIYEENSDDSDEESSETTKSNKLSDSEDSTKQNEQNERNESKNKNKDEESEESKKLKIIFDTANINIGNNDNFNDIDIANVINKSSNIKKEDLNKEVVFDDDDESSNDNDNNSEKTISPTEFAEEEEDKDYLKYLNGKEKDINEEGNLKDSKLKETENLNKKSEEDDYSKFIDNKKKEAGDIIDDRINKENVKSLTSFILKFIKDENKIHEYYIGLGVYLDKQWPGKTENYFDIISRGLSIKINNEKKDSEMQNKAFPLLFQMTSQQIKEIGVILEYDELKDFKESLYYKAYNKTLDLLNKSNNKNVK